MPRAYLLFSSQKAHTAEAVPLDVLRARTSRSGEGVAVFFEPTLIGGLFDCAVKAGQISWQILAGEKKLVHQWRLTYAMPEAQAEGRSAELLFAVQQIALAYAEDPTALAIPAFAATGSLDDEGQVGQVISVPAKVRAAREKLRGQPGSLIFIPQANVAELPAEWLQEDQTPQVVPVAHLREVLEALGIELQWSYLGCPFRGLEHFGFEHRGLFFGREDEVNACLTQLDERAQVGSLGLLVVGPSGSGKSSFVQAGILAGLLAPSLELERTPWPRKLKDNLWRPSVAGENATEAALVHSLLNGWAKVLPGLDAEWPNQLDQVTPFLIRHCPSGQPMIWVIDQLEELFTSAYAPEIFDRFGELLLSLQRQGVWVLASMRDDYLPSLLRVDSLREWQDLVGGYYYLKPLSDAAGLNAAITRPASMASLIFEKDAQGYGLDQRLQEDARGAADPLPLVEYALLQLYEQRQDNLLTWDSYTKMFGLAGAIGQQAEAVLLTVFDLKHEQGNELAAPDRRTGAQRRLLRALANYDEGTKRMTARTVPMARFDQDPHVQTLIKGMIKARLLVKYESDHVLSLRMAHEALLTQWKTAEILLEQDKADLQKLYRLETAYGRWRMGGQGQDLLLPPGLPLSEATELAKLWGPDLEQPLQDYVHSSESRAKRGANIRNATIVLLAGLFVAAVAGAWWANQQTDVAKQQTKIAIGELRRSTAMTLATGIDQYDREHPGLNSESLMRLLIAYRLNASPHVYERLQVYSAKTLGQWSSFSLRAYPGRITKIAFDPNGKRLLTGESDGAVRLWDTNTYQPIGRPLEEGRGAQITSVAFSSDGQRIASGAYDGGLYLWDANTRRLITSSKRTPHGPLNSVAISPNGKQLLTGSWGNAIDLWDAATGQLLRKPIVNQDGSVVDVGFIDGKSAFSRSFFGTLQLWDVWTGRPLAQLTKTASSVAINKTRNLIVSGNRDGTINVWNAQTGLLIEKSLMGSGHEVTSVAFSPDDREVASGNKDGTIQVWDTQTGKPNGNPLKGHTQQVTSVAFTQDGRFILSVGEDTMRLWSMCSSRSIGPMWHKGPVKGVAISPDGERLLSGSLDGTLRLWDRRTGRLIDQLLDGDEGAIQSVAFSPDGRRIVAGTWFGTLRVWDANTREPVGQPIGGDMGWVMSVAFSPNSTRFLSGSSDSFLRIFDAKTGKAMLTLPGGYNWVLSAAFSPDDKHVVSGGGDGTLRLYDANTGQPISKNLFGHYHAGVSALAYSRDGKHFVSGDEFGKLQLWDAITYRPIGGSFHGHDGWVHGVAFSPDGRRIISGGEDGILRLWNVATREPIGQPIRVSNNSVNSVAFSPDGRWVMSGSEDGEDGAVRIWPVLEGWSDTLCSCLARNPTYAEWQEWVGSVLPYQPVCRNLPVPSD